MSTPTLINLPPPPSDPVTPSDMGPGTPNSATTSLSALSTTAIKDGHQGQPHPHGHHAHHSSNTSMSSTTTLEAERADRISRLAGLERVATARAGGAGHPTTAPSVAYTPGYFDTASGMKERSTVGSASATGSVGARTTWASGSDAFDADKMSEADDGVSSVGNISDEGDASLVGFGEGASTMSGPISHPGLYRTSSSGRPSSIGSPSRSRATPMAPYSPHLSDSGHPIQQHAIPGSTSATPEPVQDARMVDGMTYDADVVDTTARTPRLATPGFEEH
ncbi:uncharacterized protein APUU_31195A [Aspergillus puulaauensis]|uniref:Uncharacterized protein n=1 Tax=Aspergillus puulaauensis TaxID=1220207 RepID=A0A7R7XK58_9EURO|nr:uncharacterized protein APUU_31195A [Aspergillus puulaauensis]BCS22970.1 hypothetical protein APUU_31195A [Aspergillus puulaauensis]